MTVSDYPDYTRVDQAAAVILDQWSGVVVGGGSDIRGPYYVGAYQGVTFRGIASAQAAGAFPLVSFEWFAQQACTDLVGTYYAGLDAVTLGTNLSLPNMGPWLRVTINRAGAGNFTEAGILVGQARYFPEARGSNFGFGELAVSSAALGIGGTATVTFNLIAAGRAHLMCSAGGSPFLGLVQARNVAGTYDRIAEVVTVAPGHGIGNDFALPPTLCQLIVVNLSGVANSEDSAVTLYQ